MTWNTGTAPTTPKNGTITNTYDGFDRLTEKKITTYNSGCNYSTELTYQDGVGTNQTTNLISSLTNGANDALEYTYDDNGNIETVSRGGVLKITYFYDLLNELIGEENADLGKTIAYTYDTDGNMTYKTEYASGVPYENRNSYNYTVQYHYTYNGTWTDLLVSYTTTLYGQTPVVRDVTYPNISTNTGLPSHYNGWDFMWQHGRELARMELPGLDDTIIFKYDDNGIRTQKSFNSWITNYSLDVDGNVIYETTPSDTIHYTYDDSGSPVSMNLNGTDYYYVKNLQGDIICIINVSGTAVVNYLYDSWGKVISTTGSLASTVGVKNPYRYRGYRYDTETGLYYLQSRYYNPEWGRFVSADDTSILQATQGQILGANLFAYCENDAINSIDSNGEKKQRSGNHTAGQSYEKLTKKSAGYPGYSCPQWIGGDINCVWWASARFKQVHRKSLSGGSIYYNDPKTCGYKIRIHSIAVYNKSHVAFIEDIRYAKNGTMYVWFSESNVNYKTDHIVQVMKYSSFKKYIRFYRYK